MDGTQGKGNEEAKDEGRRIDQGSNRRREERERKKENMEQRETGTRNAE